MPPPVRFGRNLMAWIVFAVLAVLLMSVVFRTPREELSPTTFWAYVKNGYVKSFVV